MNSGRLRHSRDPRNGPPGPAVGGGNPGRHSSVGCPDPRFRGGDGMGAVRFASPPGSAVYIVAAAAAGRRDCPTGPGRTARAGPAPPVRPVLSGRDQASPTPLMTIPHPLRVPMLAKIYGAIIAIQCCRRRKSRPSAMSVLSPTYPSFLRKREPRDFGRLLLGPRFRGDDEFACPQDFLIPASAEVTANALVI